MAINDIAISEEAYKRLKKLKLPGDSFTDVLLRELPDPCETCGEVLESFKTRPVPEADPKLRETMLRGRRLGPNRR